jgi:hypothetical protein
MRNKKKEKTAKSKQQREEEVESFMTEFLALGIPIDHPGSQEFFKVCTLFASEGVSGSAGIKLFGFKRIVVYVLSTQPHIKSSVRLAYDPHV